MYHPRRILFIKRVVPYNNTTVAEVISGVFGAVVSSSSVNDYSIKMHIIVDCFSVLALGSVKNGHLPWSFAVYLTVPFIIVFDCSNVPDTLRKPLRRIATSVLEHF